MRMMIPWFVTCALVLSSLAFGQDAVQLPLMPWPASVKTSPASGHLVIEASFSLGLESGADPRLRKTAVIFLNDLRRHTGMLPLDFSIVTAKKAQLNIHGDGSSKEVQALGEDESYILAVTPLGGELSAPTTLGVMRGLQTFLQLI